MMPSMEGTDMDMGIPSYVWNTLAPLVLNLVDLWKGEEEEEEEEGALEGLGEGLDPQLEDLNSGS